MGKKKVTFTYGETCYVKVDGVAVADARVFRYDNMLVIDDLMTYEDHRRMGYGSLLVDKLKAYCKANDWTLKAYGIVRTERAIKFWAKHNVEDCWNQLNEKVA